MGGATRVRVEGTDDIRPLPVAKSVELRSQKMSNINVNLFTS